jgi:alkyl-hydroperoxide reductase/thiol specific antioxidant family protein
VQKNYSQIRALGGEVLVISFSPPDRLIEYGERNPLPFPVLSDPDRQAYHSFALERATWGRMIRPGALCRFLKLLLRGWWPWSPGKNDDLLQMGGDFILDADRRLLFAHRSAEPTDRPRAEKLLQILRSLQPE